MLTIHLLPALYGDTFLIDVAENENQENTNILIDCGFNFTSGLRPLMLQYHAEGKYIDRFIITHYDDDHISSAAKFIRDNGPATSPSIIKIEQVWLNAYRHLQFEKRELPPLDNAQESQLKNFIAVHSQDDSKESQIGAMQASKLGKELFAGGYLWNEDFQGDAACIENKTEVVIKKGVKITLLGPDRTQLKVLESEFVKELKRSGVELSDSVLIDDAFELYVKSAERADPENYTGKISGSMITSLTAESIENMIKKVKYTADKAPGNGSSISFILEAECKKILLLADAHAEPVIHQLRVLYPGQEKLVFDAVKVSHHGSLANNPKEVYDYIDSPLYLISTNGGHPSHDHPDLETILFIISRPLPESIKERKLVFNYKPEHLPGIFDEQLQKELNYTIEVSNKIELL